MGISKGKQEIMCVCSTLSREFASKAQKNSTFFSPRSRNYVAYKSTWWPLNDDAPWPESDVQSLNTGGAAARCGKVNDRNYDSPKNNKGSALANQVQGTYEEGSLIDLYVVLSAPHGGHFVYKVWLFLPS